MRVYLNKALLIPAFHLAVVLALVWLLFAPGYWGADALNAYIHAVNGEYGGTQPALLSVLCKLTHSIYPGPLILFMAITTSYYTGLALTTFGLIENKIVATASFWLIALWPPLLANIVVIQTEALQLATISLFISGICLYTYLQNRLPRSILIFIQVVLLILFTLARHDAWPVTGLLAILFALQLGKQRIQHIATSTTAVLVFLFAADKALDKAVGFNPSHHIEMRNAVMLSDIAAISVSTNTNYIPNYCWQPYLSTDERTVNRIQTGAKGWERAWFSYLFNTNAKVGLLSYPDASYKTDIHRLWIRLIIKHPFAYIKHRLVNFYHFISSNYFSQSLWSSVHLESYNRAYVEVARSGAVDSFLAQYTTRFIYRNNAIYLNDTCTNITDQEVRSLKAAVSPQFWSAVDWMAWYSSIPVKAYTTQNKYTVAYVTPFFLWFHTYFKWLCFIALYALLPMLLIVASYRERERFAYYKACTILCLAALLNIGFRLFIITDPIYRFGIVSVLLTALAAILYVGYASSKRTS